MLIIRLTKKSNPRKHHVNRLKKKNMIIISIDPENGFDKISFLLLIETPRKFEIVSDFPKLLSKCTELKATT